MHRVNRREEIAQGTIKLNYCQSSNYLIVVQLLNDRKMHFIGCSGFRHEHPRFSHKYSPIPKHIQEDLLVQLFKNDGVFDDADHPVIISLSCAFVTQPWNGGRGMQHCRE